jgi:SAM-dependent methyltransferase
METCVEQAWEAGLVRIELEVFASNTIAIALYENLGFKIEGRNVRARYLDGEWAWDDSDSQRSFVEWVGFPDAIQSASEADAIEQITGLKPSATVLDVGCGAGRHAIEFARRGHRVKGIDPAASFIDIARAAALDASVDVQFRVQDAVDLTEVDFYDQAFAFNHTPGFLEPNQLVQHLAVIQKSLRLCGQFLLVMAGPKMTPTWPPRPAKDWADRSDSLILSEKRYKGPYRLERNLIIDVTGDEIIDLNERQRAYSLEEITRCLESAGFNDIVAIRNLEGESATDRSFGVFLCA